MKKCCAIAGLLLSGLLAASAQATVITFGELGSQISDGGFSAMPRLQQDYAASRFGDAPVHISAISFYTNGGERDSLGTFNLYLSTNPNGSALAPQFADNVSADRSLFASLSARSFDEGLVTFSGSFDYDPATGDLIIDILSENTEYGLMFSWTSQVSRLYTPPDNTADTLDGHGLATAITLGQPETVPEPAPLALMAAGLLGLAAARHDRKRRKPA